MDTVYKKFEEISGSMKYKSDETAITTVQTFPNVTTQKGLKQVRQVTSRERIACCFVNASGNTVSLFVVLLCINFKLHMLWRCIIVRMHK